MATGSITVFEEAKADMIENGWNAADSMKVSLHSVTPTAAAANPVFSSFTEAAPATGNYTAGGEVLDTLANCVTEAGGVMTFDDTGASVTWAQHASNPTNATHAVIYNLTTGSQALCFIDLGGTIDMTAGALTITWPAGGIFTIT